MEDEIINIAQAYSLLCDHSCAMRIMMMKELFNCYMWLMYAH